MGPWNIYFLAKIALHLNGSIALAPWANLLFAAALLVPVRSGAWRRTRNVAATVAGGALLYAESFLPPLRALLAEARGLTGFSADYLLELAGRLLNPGLALGLLLIAVVATLANRWLRVTSVVLLALAVVPFLPVPRPTGTANASTAAKAADPAAARTDHGARLTGDTQPVLLERAVERFFAREQARTLAFPQVSRDIDVIVLQVCSLAWSDLQAIGAERHRLFERFDVLFTRFNSAASYSGPAAIRLLRGTCGQQPHDQLYDAAAPDCQLMGRLQQAGFEPQLLLNHDGRYGNFRRDLAVRGGLDLAPQPTAGARVALQSFDGTPVTEDYDTLRQWWQRRVDSGKPRVALYYNTITLHDGNRQAGATDGWLRSYPRRARRLLDDLDRFIAELERSSARAVVVVVPEHGAAFHAAPGQIAGLRQVPGPDVTLVPVGVRLVGVPVQATARPLRVDASVSYLGLNQFLANVLAAAEADAGAVPLGALAAGLHRTPFVAEHEGVMVVRAGDGYYRRGPDRRWEP